MSSAAPPSSVQPSGVPPSDVSKPKDEQSTALSKLFTSPLDAKITQLTRILSTAAGIDSTFCLLGYSSVFLSSQLALLAQHPPTAILPSKGSKSQNPAATWQAKLLEASAGAKALGGLCSDMRTFFRLWGLLKIYLGMKAAYLTPPKDKVLRALSWTQLSSMAVYYYLENRVYLTTKGVLKGWDTTTIGKKLRAAIVVFTVYLVLDFVRLYRVWQLQARVEDASEKDEKIAREDENRAWWRSFQVDSSYFPLCFHWGTPDGLLSPWWADFWVGLAGASAGFASFREQVRVTSL